MKPQTLFCFLMLAGVTTYGQYNSKNLKLEPQTTQARFTYGNLKLYPIYANEEFKNVHGSVGKFDNLEQALKQEKIVISEKGDETRANIIADTSALDSNRIAFIEPLDLNNPGAEVNRLFIENTSGDTILLLAGEVVQGGQQDRVLAQDVLLKPNSKTDISVFCVEPHRWHVEEGGDKRFDGYVKVSNASVRKKAVVNKSQEEVWDEVGRVNATNKTETPTGTYTALQSSEEFTKELDGYLGYFTPLFTGQTDIIGVVVVSGDKILGCDMFATPELFQNNFSNLLHSYATEAISYGKKPSVTYEQVQDYMDKLLADEEKQEKIIEENGQMLKEKDVKYHITTF